MENINIKSLKEIFKIRLFILLRPKHKSNKISYDRAYQSSPASLCKKVQENGGKGIDWRLLSPTKQFGEPFLGTYITFCRS